MIRQADKLLAIKEKGNKMEKYLLEYVAFGKVEKEIIFGREKAWVAYKFYKGNNYKFRITKIKEKGK
jgi:hypothetical protein